MNLSNEAMLEALISSHSDYPNFIGDLMERLLSAYMPEVQKAAALALLRARLESADLTSAAQAVMTRACTAHKPHYFFGDIVGTGGDGLHTINVSTLASLVAAASGMPIAKHGSVSVSSRSGSADFLAALGLRLDATSEHARACLDKFGWCFLFAPLFHPSFKAVKELRQKLGIKTIFNILGPLVNPWEPKATLLGVYDQALIKPAIETLKALGRQKALVVHGSGLDEIALHGPTTCALLKDGHIEYFFITPKDLGLKEYALSDITGSSAQNNAKESIALLKAQGSMAKISFIAASAGALLWLGNFKTSLQDSVNLAQDTLFSAKAFELLSKIQEFHHGS